MELPPAPAVPANSEPPLPFGIPDKEYIKNTKNLKSLTNWSAKCDKKNSYGLTVDYWSATGPSKSGGRTGHGMAAGVRTVAEQNFEHHSITNIISIYFDAKCDSWILMAKTGTFYRIAWANAFQNPRYPHHKSRDEVNQILRSCQQLTIY